MNSESYYEHQGKCRGIVSVDDVRSRLQAHQTLYDVIFSKWLPKNKKAIIFEAACGPGMVLAWLKSNQYENVEACDISEHEVNLAKNFYDKVYLADAIAQIALHKESLDCIIAFDFVEHLEKPIFLEFMRAANSALKKGGCVILRMPNGDSPFVGRNLFNDITHKWAYTTTAMKAISVMSGFTGISFMDDTYASIKHGRALKLPVMWVSQTILKCLFRSATRENCEFIGSSVFVSIRK